MATPIFEYYITKTNNSIRQANADSNSNIEKINNDYLKKIKELRSKSARASESTKAARKDVDADALSEARSILGKGKKEEKKAYILSVLKGALGGAAARNAEVKKQDTAQQMGSLKNERDKSIRKLAGDLSEKISEITDSIAILESDTEKRRKEEMQKLINKINKIYDDIELEKKKAAASQFRKLFPY